MIYIIGMIIILIFLAVLFREELKTDTYECLSMIAIGALVWPATLIWMISAWFEWRRG